MDFNFDNLFSQLVISCLGMAFFMYGKKRRACCRWSGASRLSVFPYFVTNFWGLWGVTIGVLVALYYLRNR